MWSPNELLKIEKQRDILSYITLQFFHFKKVPLEHYPFGCGICFLWVFIEIISPLTLPQKPLKLISNTSKKEVSPMNRFEYIVESIDGDYAHLRRTDIESDELKLAARALLPPEIMEGTKLLYEWMQYSIME